MIRASNVDVELDLGSIPFLDGAEDTARAGILSSLQPQNVRLRRAIANLDEAGKDLRFPLLFDPQTSGGLLAGVPAERSADCIDTLRELGYAKAASIGHVLPQSNQLEPIAIRF
jgi:selenide,water dikinase